MRVTLHMVKGSTMVKFYPIRLIGPVLAASHSWGPRAVFCEKKAPSGTFTEGNEITSEYLRVQKTVLPACSTPSDYILPINHLYMILYLFSRITKFPLKWFPLVHIHKQRWNQHFSSSNVYGFFLLWHVLRDKPKAFKPWLAVIQIKLYYKWEVTHTLKTELNKLRNW